MHFRFGINSTTSKLFFLTSELRTNKDKDENASLGTKLTTGRNNFETPHVAINATSHSEHKDRLCSLQSKYTCCLSALSEVRLHHVDI